ncbi:E3 ubiquitin-protein ligase Praja-1 isoform X1 [Capsella rubella]|uniref:E3 ubiquitin-protein ligase Praja-1 isoform X1 n=1 Tax=Capsella rubella TaxID=81985 RepID=UPI000CD5263A|nr:E3 ubiquitin-protein ligase Praja-1 isoform X1 [Capsella rubella]
MDQEGDDNNNNSRIPDEGEEEVADSSFSYQRLLLDDDWELWDTYPTADANAIPPTTESDSPDTNPTADAYAISPTTEPDLRLVALTRVELIEDWFNLSNREQSQTASSLSQDVSSHELIIEVESNNEWISVHYETTSSADEYVDFFSHENIIPYEVEVIEDWFRPWNSEAQSETASSSDEYVFVVPSHEDVIAYEAQIFNRPQNVREGVNAGLTVEVTDENVRRRMYENSSDESEICVICQDKLKQGEEASKLDCGHDYHFGCIRDWLMVRNKCPLCNQPVV